MRPHCRDDVPQPQHHRLLPAAHPRGLRRQVEDAHKEALVFADNLWARICIHNRPSGGRTDGPPDGKMVWGKPEELLRQGRGGPHSAMASVVLDCHREPREGDEGGTRWGKPLRYQAGAH